MHVFISRLYSEFLKCRLFYNKNLLNNILIGEDCVLFCIYVIFLLLSLKDSIQTQLTLAKCDQLSKKKKKKKSEEYTFLFLENFIRKVLMTE